MKIIKGNLLALAEAGEFDIIVQGCNCFNTMGSGLAGQICKKYPEVFEADCKTRCGDHMKLGTYTKCAVNGADCNVFWVINAYTQYHFNKPGESLDLFEYTAFQLILEKLDHSVHLGRIGFPLIGCGLAGGDKTRIMKMISDFADIVEAKGKITVTVVEFE